MANITNGTGAYMEVQETSMNRPGKVQETSQNRPGKVKLQVCFLQAIAQKMLIKQNQLHYPPE